MKAITLLFGFIPLPGAPEVHEDHLTHYLVVTAHHNQKPWWKRLTKKAIKGYKNPFNS